MSGTDDVWRLLEEADALPYGPTRTALAERAVDVADRAGDPDLQLHSRLELHAAYAHGGEPAKGLVPFSWCLAAYDARRGELDDAFVYRVLWQFKWATMLVLRFPTVPWERIAGSLEQMADRYRADGRGWQAVEKARWALDRHRLGTASAEDAYRRWRRTPRDLFSDCQACDPADAALHLFDLGRDAEGLELDAPVRSGERTCLNEPHHALANSLVPLVRTGALDAAREAHLRGLRMVRRDRDKQSAIADHLRFCALTGNEARGLEILGQHLDLLDAPRDPWSELWFTTAAARLLRAAAERGVGAEPVVGGAVAGAPAMTVEELARRCRTRAEELATAYDHRNATSTIGDRVRARLVEEPLADVSLGAVGPRLQTVTRVDVMGAAAPEDEGPTSDAVPDVDALDAPQLLAELERAVEDDDMAARQQMTDRWERRRSAGAATAGGSEVEMRLDLLLARSRISGESAEVALAAADRALSIADRLGDAAAAVAARGLRGLARVAAGDDGGLDDTGAALAAALDVDLPVGAAAGRDRHLVADARARHAHALRVLGRGDEAEEHFVRARAAYVAAGDDRAVVDVDRELAFLAPDLATAGERLAQVAAAYAATGRPWRAMASGLTAGRMLHDVGEPERAVEVLAAAWALASEAPAADAALGATVRVDLADALLTLDRADEADAHALAALPVVEDAGLSGTAAQVRVVLAAVRSRQDRVVEAAELVETALLSLEEHDDPRLAARAHGLLSGLAESLGETSEAARHAEAAAAQFERLGWPYARARTLIDAARLRAALDDHARAAALYEAADSAAAEAEELGAAADARRGRARALTQAGDAEGAVLAAAAAREAVDRMITLARAAGDGTEVERLGWHAADLADDEARALAQAGRHDEAIQRALEAAEGFRAAGDEAAALATDGVRGVSLLQAGREDEAEVLLRRVLDAAVAADLPDVRAAAVAPLCSLLARTGRTEDAEQLWAEHTDPDVAGSDDD